MHTPGTQMMVRGTLLRHLRGGHVQLRLADGSLITTSERNLAVEPVDCQEDAGTSGGTARKRKP